MEIIDPLIKEKSERSIDFYRFPVGNQKYGSIIYHNTEMDIFYVIVPSIAIIILILILTFIGIKMVNKKTASGKNVFPPQYSNCPDYWQFNNDKKCVVPLAGARNSLSTSLSTTTTAGYDSASSAIDFNSSGWSSTGSSICKQKMWANSNNVTWDGVSNYNGC